MAELSSVLNAIRNAEAAGDTPAVLRLTQLARDISAQDRAQQAPREMDYPEANRRLSGYLGTVPRGIAAGIAGLGESALLGASNLLPEEQELAAREAITRGGAAVQEAIGPKELYRDTLVSKLSQGLGSTVPFLAAAPFGVPGLIAAGATGVAAGSGEATQRAIAAGATEEEIGDAALLGIGPGALEMFAPLAIVKRFGTLKKALGSGTATDVVSKLRRVAQSAGEEGLQEAVTEVGQNLIAQGVYDPNTGTFSGTGESFGLGAGVGGLLQGLFELALPRDRAGAPPSKSFTAEETADLKNRAVEPLGLPGPANTLPSGPVPANTLPEEAVAEGEILGPEVAPPLPALPQGTYQLPAPPTGDGSAIVVRPDGKAYPARYAAAFEEAIVEEERLRTESPQRELFTEMLSGEKTTITKQELNRLGITSKKLKDDLTPLNLTDPEDAKKAIDTIVEYANDKTVKSRYPAARSRALGLLNMPILTRAEKEIAASTPAPVEEAPLQDPQMSLEEQALNNVAIEDAARVAEETEAAFAAQEAPVVAQQAAAPAQTQEAFEQIREQGLEERLAADATARAATTPTEVVSPLAAALQGAIDTNQGQELDAQIAAEQRVIESEEATRASDEEIVARAMESVDNPAPAFFKDTSVTDGLASLAESLSVDGLNANNTKSLEWVKSNLSADAEGFVTELTRAVAAAKGKPLTVAAVLKTSEPVSADTLAKLQAGDLRGAINDLTKVKEASVASVARAIEKGLGNTKVVMASNVVNESGEAVAGLYDPTTDTITLNQDVTQSNHILLHEAMHAVTSHELTKNTPAATQMRNLFDGVKDALDTAYGATNIDEFVAEAFSNPEFQAKLASISIKGDRLTLWDKFTNIIGNIMRRFRGQPSIKIESAKDKVDSLIADLISPAPEYRNATVLPSATIKGTNAKLADQLGKFVTSKVSPQDIAAVSGYMSQASVAARKLWLSALPLPAIPNVIEAKMPEISRLGRALVNTIQDKAGSRQKGLTKVTDTAKELERLAKKLTPEQQTALDDVIAQATTSRVDPDKPRAAYAFKSDREGDSARQRIWDRSQPAWRELEPEAKQMYRIMRDAYAEQYAELRKTFEERIDVLETNPALNKQIKDTLLERVFGKDAIDPYFPLHRKGNYWLSYNARVADPFTGEITTEPHYEAFASIAQRNLAKLELKANKDVVGGIEEIEKAARNGSGSNRSADVGTTFKMMKGLKDAGIDPATEKLVLNMLLDAMPERALASSLRTRKGTPGFERDTVKVFRERMPNIVSQTVNLQYETKLSVLSEQIAEAKVLAADAAPNDNERMYVNQTADHLQEYIDFAKNPQLATWSKALKSGGFGMTLGFNVSSVLVNWTNIPVVVLPYLGGKYGYKDAQAALYNAHKQFLKAPTARRREGFNGKLYGTDVKEGWSLSNIDFSDPNLSPELKKYEILTNLLDMRGQSNTTMTSEALETRNPVGGVWNKVNATMGYMFHQGERLNRQVSAMATFDLELKRIADKKYSGDVNKITEADQQAAAQEALNTTELTNSGALTETAPRLAQSNWGSVIAMYKRFGVSMLYLQGRMAKQTLDNALPIELERIAFEKYAGDQSQLTEQDRAEAQEAANLTKTIAKKQIAGLFASSAVMAGVQGLPLYGVVAFIMNTVFLDDEEEDFDTLAAEFFGEGMYSGAINATMGVDVAPRIGMTNLIFRSLPNKEQDSLVLQGLELLAGPVYGVTARALDGISLINEGETRRGFEKVLPSFASNVSKSLRYSEEGVTTLRGDPIVEDVGVMGVAAQLIGLAPASYTQQIERNSVDKRIDRNISSRRTKLLRKYYLAKKNYDADGVSEVEEAMREFNARHPEVAIDDSTKERSLKQHQRTTEKMRKLRGVSISSKREEKVLQARRDAGLE